MSGRRVKRDIPEPSLMAELYISSLSKPHYHPIYVTKGDFHQACAV
jgi:hypothetical protein